MSIQDPSDEPPINPLSMSALETEIETLDKEVETQETNIETRIRGLQPTRKRLMFSELAEAFPDCTWQILFSALSRLSKQKHVELVAHRWDYEVIFLNTGSSEHDIPGSSRTNERCEHDERAQV
jgi:hypothetical protein